LGAAFFSRLETPVALELGIESALIAADRSAPRRNAATVCAARHPGVNEDRVLCDPGAGVAAIFDGIGGEAGGELASRAACAAVAMDLDRLPPQGDIDGRARWLTTSLQGAQAAITLSRRLHKNSPRQGTTVIAALLAGDKVLTACVGDSRAYRARNGALELIADEYEDTFPRPAIADALDRITCVEDFQAAPESLPWAFAHRNLLAVALGDDVSATVRKHDVASEDVIVITSDGVHDNLAHHEMQAVVAACGDKGPQALCSALVEQAQRRSQDPEHLRAKDDDVTCAVLQVP
jgi:serine/threonine protein phosphatase PrpC